jgi:hypothetical protein
MGQRAGLNSASLNGNNSQRTTNRQCSVNHDPAPPDPDTVILPWVWTYLYKVDPITLEDVQKSRGTCNGGTRFGKVVTLAETYATCVKQPAHRLTWSLIAALNYVGLGCDMSNAFAEAPAPKEPFYNSETGGKTAWTNHQSPKAGSFQSSRTCKATQRHPDSGKAYRRHSDHKNGISALHTRSVSLLQTP